MGKRSKVERIDAPTTSVEAVVVQDEQSAAQLVDQAKPLSLSGRFVTTKRVAHLLYETFEVTLKDGVVVETKKLSRAPDMAAVAIGHASSKLWEISRDR